MEEITKRFEIVRLAVELGDTKTIEVQCDALRSLSLDENLDEIIDLLESRNYRQALYGMKIYAEKLKDEFFDEPKQSRPTSRKTRAENSVEPGLFDLEPVKEAEPRAERALDVEDLLRLSRENRKPKVKEYVPAPTFDLESDREREAPIFELEESAPVREPAPTMKDREEGEEEPTVAEDTAAVFEETEIPKVQGESGTIEEEGTTQEAGESEEAVEEPIPSTTVPSQAVHEEEEKDRRYSPIPYIGQKFRNMIHQFPPVEEAEAIPEEVEAMQRKIAKEGYTESEIEGFLEHYRRYKEAGRKGEAALVLLLAAATESQFAQFLLARELFKGEVIQEDHAEAFTQINTLADQNFPEAICDLAQFYEYGVGIGKDRQLALLLYEEAAEMGVARAARHYQRLKNSRGLKGLLGKVKLPDLSLKLPNKS